MPSMTVDAENQPDIYAGCVQPHRNAPYIHA
jgi:hypothetical protein